MEIAVVVERFSPYGEATILEDNDETIKYLTICGAVDNSTISPIRLPSNYLRESQTPEKLKMNATHSSSSSSASSQNRSKKVSKWLESVESAFEV